MTKLKMRTSFLMVILLIVAWMFRGDCQTGETINMSGPEQPAEGPGGAAYLHDSVAMFNYAEEPDGYWLFQPASPTPTAAPVVVFLHGYGAFNPMIYGKWIRHLVQRGNVVVFPRYQKNIFSPAPVDFIPNTVTAIKDALQVIDSVHHITPLLDNFAIAGHSYGGVIAAGMTADYVALGIPQPKSVLLCSPGSGPFKGGVLESYENIPEDTKMVIMVSSNDVVVGDKLGVVIFETATNAPHRNLIRQLPDHHNVKAPIHAGHNECYSLDRAFDSGLRNMTTKRALYISEHNALDFNGYWKLFDALIDCNASGKHCDTALGNTAAQRSLGSWSDGKPLRELIVLEPGEAVNQTAAGETKGKVSDSKR